MPVKLEVEPKNVVQDKILIAHTENVEQCYIKIKCVRIFEPHEYMNCRKEPINNKF